MKKIILVMLTFILLLSFSGCSKFLTLGSVETNTSTKMSMKYYYFNGTKVGHVTVDKDETLVINVDIKSEKGSLDAYIYNDGGENDYQYEGHDIPTSSFTVNLSEPGDYTIKVVGDKHKGSYSFTWE